jgi:hypothetical protein
MNNNGMVISDTWTKSLETVTFSVWWGHGLIIIILCSNTSAWMQLSLTFGWENLLGGFYYYYYYIFIILLWDGKKKKQQGMNHSSDFVT